jgi:hypothetical protein
VRGLRQVHLRPRRATLRVRRCTTVPGQRRASVALPLGARGSPHSQARRLPPGVRRDPDVAPPRLRAGGRWVRAARYGLLAVLQRLPEKSQHQQGGRQGRPRLPAGYEPFRPGQPERRALQDAAHGGEAQHGGQGPALRRRPWAVPAEAGRHRPTDRAESRWSQSQRACLWCRPRQRLGPSVDGRPGGCCEVSDGARDSRSQTLERLWHCAETGARADPGGDEATRRDVRAERRQARCRRPQHRRLPDSWRVVHQPRSLGRRSSWLVQ